MVDMLTILWTRRVIAGCPAGKSKMTLRVATASLETPPWSLRQSVRRAEPVGSTKFRIIFTIVLREMTAIPRLSGPLLKLEKVSSG